jgi:alanine dehydrogenase
MVGTAVRHALGDVAAGVARGGKLVMEVSPAPGDRPPLPLLRGERSNWKLSTLVALNATHGAVKIVGSNAANRARGLPRSQSLLVLYDKSTMRPSAIFDGTAISSARTAAYASITLDAMQPQGKVDIFLVGAGVLAGHILADLQAMHAASIGTVYVRSLDLVRTQAFVTTHRHAVGFDLVAVADNAYLRRCPLLITASNASTPVFALNETKPRTVVLHLGGDETPPEFIAAARMAGALYCDDAAAVAQRNSQSIARYFLERGQCLAKQGQALGVRPVVELLDHSTPALDGPTLITCVGLPALDLYVLLALQGLLQLPLGH